MADEHMAQAAILLEEVDGLRRRRATGDQHANLQITEKLAEAQIHATLHLAEQVGLLVAERER